MPSENGNSVDQFVFNDLIDLTLFPTTINHSILLQYNMRSFVGHSNILEYVII
jgi:hypothetical protein